MIEVNELRACSGSAYYRKTGLSGARAVKIEKRKANRRRQRAMRNFRRRIANAYRWRVARMRPAQPSARAEPRRPSRAHLLLQFA